MLFVILPGIAGYYIFKARGLDINPDDTFATLFRTLVPVGYGFGGIIMVGLIGGVLSTYELLYNKGLVAWFPNLVDVFGATLNFFHQLIMTFFTASLLFVIISKLTEATRSPENEKHTLAAVLKRSTRTTAPFWQSEKPWVVLLVAATATFLLWFR